jgi:benzylsuccinate CoA-transferase BbsF subunit
MLRCAQHDKDPSFPIAVVDTTMTTSLPLEGVRVADLSWIIAGPYGTYLLARMGAEVIKVEGIAAFDHIRDNPPFADGVRGLNRSGFFNSINPAKKSVTLQLDNAQQLQMAREIIVASDIVVEAFSFGTMERMGLGYEELRKEKPELIMLSCTGFGQTGRDRSLRAFMGTVHAYTGLNSVNGHEGGPPKAAGGTWADYATGLALVFAVLAALRHRRRTGCGQRIDLAMSDVVLAMMGAPFMDYFLNGRVDVPHGNAGSATPQDAYPCKGDGFDKLTTGDAWVAVSVETDEQWDALCGVIDDAELARPEYRDAVERRRHTKAIDERIAAWTRERTALEATEALQAAGVPAGPSSSSADSLAQPQFRARGFFMEPEHAEVGRRRVPNMPWRLSTQPDQPCAPPPLLGEHNEEVLGELLGRPREVVDAINAARDEVLGRMSKEAPAGLVDDNSKGPRR